MTYDRKTMISSLNQEFVPEIRKKGFEGIFPHFKRKFDDRIDLLSFMFDKYGGAFLIEISTVFLNQKFNNLMFKDKTDLSKINAFSTNYRHRIRRKDGEIWFYYWDLYKIKYLFFTRGIIFSVSPDRPLEEVFSKKFIEKKKVKKIFSVDQYIFKNLAQEATIYLDQAEKWWTSFEKKWKKKNE